MIKADQIPDEVVDRIWERCEWRSWLDVRDAIAAALNAWPWKFTTDSIKMEHIVLPLPTEASDE